ncbi:hypothetical protein KA005_48715, partial [bacterium]|nr:hypothetical protein [bacterium]
KGEKWEGDFGAAQLNQRCGLRPLQIVGTRIIIVDPIVELIEALENGQLARAIQETWFRAIEKKRAMITVCQNGSRKEVELPLPHPFPGRDSRDHKVWPLKNEEIKIPTGERYRIKKFNAVYLDSSKISEEMQGIAIIHNGMKITSLPMSAAPPNVRERVTGFIEFDRELDRELRKGQNQHPNHYDLKWKRRIPHAIKVFINQQLEAFGREKLGLGTDPRKLKKIRRTNAEEWAIRQLMKYAPDLDLFGAKGTKRPPGPTEPTQVKPIGISISNFAFPDPEIAPRVNWGQQFTELGVTAYNHQGRTRDVVVKSQVFYGDLPVLTLINRERFSLVGKGQRFLGPFEISIEKGIMPEPGVYRLVASLFDAKTGDRIDKVPRRFWVEKDPPFKKPFDLRPAPGFQEPYKHRQWLPSGSINNSPVVYYNVWHPAYKLAEESEEQQQEYLFEIVLEAAIHFVLNRPNQEDGTPDYHPLEREHILGTRQKPVDQEEVPANTYEEIAKFVSETRWRMLEGE